MGDDARTRGIKSLLDDHRRRYPDPDITWAIHPAAERALDVLLAAGWRPPVSDDTKAKARDVAENASAEWNMLDLPGTRWEAIVAALAAAGLLGGPSDLDRLAAWVTADSTDDLRALHVHRNVVSVEIGTELMMIDEYGRDAQEAARLVLARLEATDG